MQTTYRTARAYADAMLATKTGEELAEIVTQLQPVTIGQRLVERWLVRELVYRQLYGEPVIELVDLSDDTDTAGDEWKRETK